MVDTIGPAVGEARRGGRRVALVLHLVGASASAFAVGAFLGLVGYLLGAPWALGAVMVALVALLYALRDGFELPIPLPDRGAQVPEWWGSFFSLPVAALFYGIGLGIGFFTYLGVGTFVAVVTAAFVSGDPVVGGLMCVPFGFARGLSPGLAWLAGGRSGSPIDRLEGLGSRTVIRHINAVGLSLMALTAILTSVSPR